MGTVGYSFLVGRTYTTGYRTLLAPGGLADVGALSRLVVPGRDGVQTATVDGRALTVVCRTEQLGPSDVDEHGRPVVLVHGFVSPVPLAAVDPGDVERARAEALAAYRRAKTRDDTTHETSAPFPLASPPLAVPERARPRPMQYRRYGLLAVAVVLVAALVGGGWALLRPDTVDGWTGTWSSDAVTVTLGCSARCDTAEATQPGCRYALDYRSGSATVLTFRAARSGTGCLADGEVELRRTSETTADLRWSSGPEILLETGLAKTAGG